MRTSAIPRRVRQLCVAAKEVALETLWPTRCAGCDTPGERVLCARCERALAYIDACHACPTCGAPFGRIQCTQCNEVVLASLGLDALPVDGMTHAVMLDDTARRIVTLYKDADERRLAHDIARLLVRYVSPDRVREGCIISYIPDSASALRRRGFDHARELAEACAMRTSMPCASLFARPDSLDQRTLGKRGLGDVYKRQRWANAGASPTCQSSCTLPRACASLARCCLSTTSARQVPRCSVPPWRSDRPDAPKCGRSRSHAPWANHKASDPRAQRSQAQDSCEPRSTSRQSTGGAEAISPQRPRAP